jgi:hypothetical protein
LERDAKEGDASRSFRRASSWYGLVGITELENAKVERRMISRKTIVLLTLAFGVTAVAVIGAWAFSLVGRSFSGSPNVPGGIIVHHAAWADALEVLSYLVGITVFPGVITYLLISRDFHGWGTALTTMGCVILVGVGSWVGFVFGFFAFLVSAAVYVVMRRLFRAGPALAVSAVVLAGGLAYCAWAMSVALDKMG